MTEHEKIQNFYLTNHDFNIIVNKGAQTYSRPASEILKLAIIREIYHEMQKGGCNEEQNHRGEDPRGNG